MTIGYKQRTKLHNLDTKLSHLHIHKLEIAYRISANSFRGNYSFLNLALFTVTFVLYYINLNSCPGNYSREETIQGRKLFAEIRYVFMDCPLDRCSMAEAAVQCCLYKANIQVQDSQVSESEFYVPKPALKTHHATMVHSTKQGGIKSIAKVIYPKYSKQ